MSRTIVAGVIAGLVLLWTAVAVCVSSLSKRGSRPDTSSPASEGVEPTTVHRMPFAEWDEEPTIVLLFSGQQRGRLKPCGCSPAFQKGGLAKRAGFVRYVRQDRKWPVVLLDLGGLLDDPDETYGLAQYVPGPEHRLAKLEVTLQAYAAMGYDAIGLGPEDVTLENGTLTYVSVLSEFPQLAATNCNLSVPEDLHSLIHPYVVIEREGLKIGVTGVVGKRYSQKVRDSITPLSWVPPEDSLSTVLPQLEGCDLKVLLYYGDAEGARKIARTYADFDVILYASEYDEPTGREIREGRTLLASVGKKGKYMGAIGYWKDGPEPFAFELVSLDDRFEDDPTVKGYVRELYLQKLAGLRIVELLVKKPLPEGATIAGVEACRDCHPRVVAKWEASRHALALETLKKSGDHVDPECLSCHTTYFGYQGGYDGTPATAHLGGNQCENCHGPAGQHVKDPENVLFRSQLHRESVSAEAQLCRRCHDAENDPHFEFQKRWAEVVHTQEAREDALDYRRRQKATSNR